MAFLRRNSPLGTPTILVVGGADRAGSFHKSTIIDNSATMQVGDVVATTTESSGNGIVMRRYNAAGDAVVGIAASFGQANGQSPAKDSGQTPDRVTVEADNETDKQVFVRLDVTPGAVWSAPLDATIHTTAAFGVGRWIDPATGANAGQLDESTITATTYQGRAFACLGPDEQDTTRGLVTLVESIFMLGNET